MLRPTGRSSGARFSGRLFYRRRQNPGLAPSAFRGCVFASGAAPRGLLFRRGTFVTPTYRVFGIAGLFPVLYGLKADKGEPSRMDAAAIRDVCRELAGEDDPGRIRELLLELREALAVQQNEARLRIGVLAKRLHESTRFQAREEPADG
jgi:hypothetical protein